MMQRAHNWEYLFNPSTESIQGRNTDGSFPAGAAFQTSLLEPGGEEGFEEGNAAQYTWSVPQDLSALAELMGGDTATVDALNGFFTDLNASRDAPMTGPATSRACGHPGSTTTSGRPRAPRQSCAPS